MIASNFVNKRIILIVGLWISDLVLQSSTTASCCVEAFVIDPLPSHKLNNKNYYRQVTKGTPASAPASASSGLHAVRNNEESVYIDGRSMYEILGANPNSTTEHLKSRYKELAKLTHPDANNSISVDNIYDNDDLPDFKDVSKAWKILSDEKVRLRYDRQLQASQVSQKFNTWFRKSALSVAEKLFPISPEEKDYHEGVYVDFVGGTYKGMSGHIVGDTPKKVKVRIVQEDGTEKVVMVLKRSVLKPYIK